MLPRPFHFNVWQNSLQIKEKEKENHAEISQDNGQHFARDDWILHVLNDLSQKYVNINCCQWGNLPA